MKVLIIGSGGREHALVWKITKSPLVRKVFCAPGNAGISLHAECIPVAAGDTEGLVAFANKQRIDLTVVGPEAPLASGIADKFRKRGLPVFGPSHRAAEIESSKAFAKSLMEKYGIPTPQAETFDTPDGARRYVQGMKPPVVVKADGLAAGKGVVVARTTEEAVTAIDDMMEKKIFGRAGEKVIIEEYLEGREVSALAMTDGEHILPLPMAKDHKRINDGDAGPNTGGMGAYSPVPFIDPEMEKNIHQNVLRAAVKAMESEDRFYQGVLYAGLMLTGDGPRVLEFNCRFGDPETQPIVCLIDGDIVPSIVASIEGGCDREKLGVLHGASVCVVMASGGYPGPYTKGAAISGLDEAGSIDDVVVFHAGTTFNKEGRYVTNGGRVLGVTGTGETMEDAREKAYAAVERISWEGVHFRRDIGAQA